jgi:beta-glucuronidase
MIINTALRLISVTFFMVLLAQTSSAANEGAEGLALFGAETLDLPPGPPLMTNITGRDRVSLNGPWNIVVDEHDIGSKGLFGGAYYDVPAPQTGMELVEFSFDARRQLNVPGDWNTQDERLFRYRNAVWYQRSFDLAPQVGKRYFIHFDGVNYTANGGLTANPCSCVVSVCTTSRS